MFNQKQKLKTWDELKQEYRFLENKRFLFMQLLHAISKSWKEDLSNIKDSIHNLIIQDHHIIRKRNMYFLNRLRSKEIFLLLKKKNKMRQDYIIKRSSAIAILTEKTFTF